jgi:hypothetical protein
MFHIPPSLLKKALLLLCIPLVFPFAVYSLGTRDAAAIKKMEEFAAGRKGIVVWNSRRNGGAVRIWACNLDGSNLRQVSPDENGYDHIAPLISPDGSKIIYCRITTRTNTTTWSDSKSFYADFVGDMVMVASDAVKGAGRKTLISDNCRSIFEWRFARWIDNDRIAHIGKDHNGHVYSLSSGQSEKKFNYTYSEGYGALPNPQLMHCIDGRNRLCKINNPGSNGTLTELKDFDGCQGAMTRDGTAAYRTQGDKPRHIKAMKISDNSEWSLVPPSRLPSNQNYLYFPKLSYCQRFAAVGASDGGHSHFTADYDIFVLPMDPVKLTPTGNAVKYSFASGTNGKCLDSWPDVWVSTESDPARIGRIDIAPSTVAIAKNKSAEFSAYVKDQYGSTFAAEISWSVSDGGTISPSSSSPAAKEHSATFSSDGTTGSFAVTAKSGDVSGEATVVVTDPASLHLKYNCGPNTPSVSGWEKEDQYVSGGADYAFTTSMGTAGVANAAPAELYKTVRHQDHDYSFPNIADGTYLVRLHFADAATSGRAMDYTIEGEKVLDDFSIVDAAGGANKAVVKQFTVTVDDGDGLQISARKDGGNDAFEAGIEIIGMQANRTIQFARPPVPLQSVHLHAHQRSTSEHAITYSLLRPCRIQLAIVSIHGQKIRTLFDGYASAGDHDVVWNGADMNGKSVSPGIYACQLTYGRKKATILISKHTK